MDGMVVLMVLVMVLAVAGGRTRPEGSTEHYNQSMCVGLMINPLSFPSLGGLGSSLYKGTSILLMLASKHLRPPPRFCSPLWMGARSGSQHHRIGLLGPARDRATSNCHNDHFILNQFGLSGDKGAAEPWREPVGGTCTFNGRALFDFL